MIQHTVSFTLVHPSGSDAESAFLDATLELARIPGVRDFKRLRQTSQKSDYQFSLSMVFASQTDYDAYNDHPIHTNFVEKRWMTEVKEFQEMDFTEY